MSVALVATEIGLRLAYGHLDLRTGLLVLILAPEAYLPLRALGTQFHATADGLAAAEKVFAVLETPVAPRRPPAAPRTPATAGAPPIIRVDARSACGTRAAPTPPRPGRRSPSPRPPHRPHRAQRLRQDHAAVLPARLHRADNGLDHPPPGRGPRSAAAARGHRRPSWSPERGVVPPGPPSPLPRHMRPAPAVARPPGRWLPQDPTLFAGHGGGEHPARLARTRPTRRWRRRPGRPPSTTSASTGSSASAARACRPASAAASPWPARCCPAAPVLLLDEPTAGLDAEREATVVADAPPLRRRRARGRGGEPPPGAHRRRRRGSRPGCPGRPLRERDRNRGANGGPGMTANADNSKKRGAQAPAPRSGWTGPGRCHGVMGVTARSPVAPAVGGAGTGRGWCSRRSSGRWPPPARSGCSRHRAWLISRSAQRPPGAVPDGARRRGPGVRARPRGPPVRRAARRARRRPPAAGGAPGPRLRRPGPARPGGPGRLPLRRPDRPARHRHRLPRRPLAPRPPAVRRRRARRRGRGRRRRRPVARRRAWCSPRPSSSRRSPRPPLAIMLSRREERDLVPLRGDLAAATMELLDGAAELAAFGADGRAPRRRPGQGDADGRSDHPFGIRQGSGGGGERARGGGGGLRRAVLRRSRGPRRRPRRACCSRSSCSPRWPRTRSSPGSPRPPRRSPGCAPRRPGSRTSLRRPAPVAEPAGPGGAARNRPTTWRPAA